MWQESMLRRRFHKQTKLCFFADRAGKQAMKLANKSYCIHYIIKQNYPKKSNGAHIYIYIYV